MATRHHGLFRRVNSVARPAHGEIYAKGGCYIYGNNDAGVDTGVIIEGEGVLFIGRVALKEMAEVAGFSIEDSDKLEPQVRELEIEVAHAQRERDEARADCAALDQVLDELVKHLPKQLQEKYE